MHFVLLVSKKDLLQAKVDLRLLAVKANTLQTEVELLQMSSLLKVFRTENQIKVKLKLFVYVYIKIYEKMECTKSMNTLNDMYIKRQLNTHDATFLLTIFFCVDDSKN